MSASATAKQRDALVKQLRGVTNATQADAQRLLKANSYKLDRAVDAFFTDEVAMGNAAKQSGGGAAGSENKKQEKDSREKLGRMFDQFKDEDGSDITIEGAMEMCEALEISPEDVVMLPLSFYLKSPSLGTFRRDDYIAGWRTIAQGAACEDAEAQKRLLPRLRQELAQDAPVRGERANEAKGGLFARTYDFTYTFARPEGQKSLPLESAVAFWDLVLPHSPTFQGNGTAEAKGTFTPRQLRLWKKFLAEKGGNRAISKDTWTLFLDFTKEIDEEFKTHDFDAAWPSQIDDFVEWAKEQPASACQEEDAMDESQ